MSKFEQLHPWLQTAETVLVVSHVNPDGDAVSSTLAAGKILRSLGKKVVMVNESPIPEKFQFLQGVGEILLPEEINDQTFTHVMALDCADRKRMGTCIHLLHTEAEIVNIDHHGTNDHFGTINIIEPEAAATVQLLFEWIETAQLNWDHELAKMIYTGLLTDTGGFRYSNTSPTVLRQAAKLVEMGIQAHEIADRVLESVTWNQLVLTKLALERLELSADKQVAWMSLRNDDLAQTQSDDLDGIVNIARNITGVDVGLLFRETPDGKVKVSFRSRAIVDVAKIAQSIGGGGHPRAAGCTLDSTLDQAKELVLSLVFNELESGSS